MKVAPNEVTSNIVIDGPSKGSNKAVNTVLEYVLNLLRPFEGDMVCSVSFETFFCPEKGISIAFLFLDVVHKAHSMALKIEMAEKSVLKNDYSRRYISEAFFSAASKEDLLLPLDNNHSQSKFNNDNLTHGAATRSSKQ
ncbi:hypothetical protein AKJ16_DCAP20302 [Drosera capensis]